MTKLIRISHTEGCIFVNGHAHYAEYGKDIVCAAISTITQVFIESVNRLTDDVISSNIAEGNVYISYGNLSEKSKTMNRNRYGGYMW